MPLVISFLVLIVAAFAISSLLEDYMTSRGRISESSANVLATANFTNDLVHYAQVLHSNKLQGFNVAIETSSFDKDYPIVKTIHLNRILQDAMYIHASVNLSYCKPMFQGIQHRPANDQSPNEEDQARLKRVIATFVRGTAIDSVEPCIERIDTAVQQHMYLQNLHETTSDWVRSIGNMDFSETHFYVGDRSYKLTAGVTYLSIMLEVWALETAGMRGFLVDVRKMLLEEKTRVAKEATTRTGRLKKKFIRRW